MGHATYRDHYYARKLELQQADPFDTRALPFPLRRSYERADLVALITFILFKTQSLRTLLTRENDGTWTTAPVARCLPEDMLVIDERKPDGKNRADLTSEFKINLVTEPTCFFHYNPSTFILTLICSHFAIDELSAHIIGDYIAAFGEGRQDNTSPVMYTDWMDSYFAYAISEKGRHEMQFWNDYDPKPFQYLQNRKPGARGCGRAIARLKIPPTRMTRLRAALGSFGIKPNDMAAGAVCATISKLYNLDSVPLTWTTHGRYPMGGRSFHQTCGWLSGLHPVTVPQADGALFSSAKSVQTALLSLPSWGCAYPWLNRFTDNRRPRLENELASPFLINMRQARRERAPDSLITEDRPQISVQAQPDGHEKDFRFYIVCLAGASLEIKIEAAGDCVLPSLRRFVESLADQFYLAA